MELETKPTEKEVLELQAEGFLRKNKMKDSRIDKAGDYTDCVSNCDKIYVSNAMVEFYLAMKKEE
jgi:hypothetical protein